MTIKAYLPSDPWDPAYGQTVEEALAGARAEIERWKDNPELCAGFVCEHGQDMPQRWREGERVLDMICCRAKRTDDAPPGFGVLWDYWFSLEDHPGWRWHPPEPVRVLPDADHYHE